MLNLAAMFDWRSEDSFREVGDFRDPTIDEMNQWNKGIRDIYNARPYPVLTKDDYKGFAAMHPTGYPK